MLGMSYLETGQAAKAEEPLEAALRANPKDTMVQMALAKVRIRLHKYDGAVDLLKSYTEQNPRDQEAWYLLGKTYLQLSEDSLGKINQIDPNSVVAHEVAGEIDESMHNYDGALVEYKKAIDLAPDQPDPHHAHGKHVLVDRQMGFGADGIRGRPGARSEQLHGSLEAGQRDPGGERRRRRGAHAFE